VPAGHIHRIQAEREDHDGAAREYQAEIARVFQVSPEGEPPVFDLILLGMGPDAHTASLFPGTSGLKEATRWVVPNYVPKFSTYRVTLTPRILNRGAHVYFLVAGPDKTEPLHEVLDGARDTDRLPSQLIRPEGCLVWLLDRAAAAKLATFDRTHVKLAPSILAADFARLGEQVKAAEQAGADRIHVDVMDGHFVPNISIGLPVVESLRPVTQLPLEAHLMISNPDDYLDAFAKAGADSILVHQEGNANLHRTLQHIKHLGKKAGVVINPATSAAMIEEVLPDVDLVLVMTVNPGFGGQEFLRSTLPKLHRVRTRINEVHPACELEVDGGIDAATLPVAFEAGARVFVAGSSVFHVREGVAVAMDRLRASVG
jgi:ribulose-phosphate 3-epimerase